MQALAYVAVFCFILSTIGQVTCSHGNKNRCHHKRLRRCTTAISHLTIPMIESKNPEEFKNPPKTVRKFCRKVHPKLNCIYNQLADCDGKMNTRAAEERAGVLSYVCGEGRKDLIMGSTCWLDNNVTTRLPHCREKHKVDNIIAKAKNGNITDTYEMCSALDDYVWSCVGDWTMKRCQYNLAAFLIRVVNPETLTRELEC